MKALCPDPDSSMHRGQWRCSVGEDCEWVGWMAGRSAESWTTPWQADIHSEMGKEGWFHALENEGISWDVSSLQLMTRIHRSKSNLSINLWGKIRFYGMPTGNGKTESATAQRRLKPQAWLEPSASGGTLVDGFWLPNCSHTLACIRSMGM